MSLEIKLTEEDFNSEELNQAALAITLGNLSTAVYPELLIAQTLAHLMSEEFWKLKTKKRFPKFSKFQTFKGKLIALQKYVNTRYHHLTAKDVFDLYGYLDLNEEKERLEPEIVDYTTTVIKAGVERIGKDWWEAEGREMDFFLMISPPEGLYTNYRNSIFPIMQASKKLNPNERHNVHCADEVTLFAAMVHAFIEVPLKDIYILGGPLHYMLFVNTPNGGFLFNRKNELFNTNSWINTAHEEDKTSKELFLDRSQNSFDRIISFSGAYNYHSSVSSIRKSRLRELRAALKKFFGFEFEELSESRLKGLDYQSDPLYLRRGHYPALKLKGLGSGQAFCEKVKQLAVDNSGSAYEQALYSARRIIGPIGQTGVRHPSATLLSTLREYRVREKAQEFGTLDEAIKYIEELTDGSIFPISDEGHLLYVSCFALPDETLLHQQGDPFSKALLLYALLHHTNINIEGQPVTYQDMWIETSREQSSLYFKDSKIKTYN